MFVKKPPSELADHELERHPSWRRYTRRYRRKRELVKTVWIVSGLLMIGLPAAAPVLALGTTFVSFMILDESA